MDNLTCNRFLPLAGRHQGRHFSIGDIIWSVGSRDPSIFIGGLEKADIVIVDL